mgnify:CR=1 FL=1
MSIFKVKAYFRSAYALAMCFEHCFPRVTTNLQSMEQSFTLAL